ncbi:hypothetical protein CO059_02120 [candidate division WWE3 bacterium CG_4_9_14_0_2_um_filter_48_10]|uniref:Uncharacterized protein n=1 Tax=candidate division WWE3 bacterium CG_4_9_14_0_2_um_filter_48_10 TaxID=1975078 RepID=A0A2M8EIW5_UNCKA|nr:MAG: hypothetical protein CO059_02120 [candidate division WWE3 bacterium CG_4_9_14_0_2_um_filter_48_10]PJE65310.1 MAG: hypothetical protein COU91_02405 [Candidatus Saccharibacteria bacterium CG10_big_fil_rev_8_21_14_0_10_47_8]
MISIRILAALVDGTNLPRVDASPAKLQDILSIIFGTIGALAFFVMVLGGFKYVLSGGDPTKVATAKSTIIYAGVGVVVAASAAIIVNFVLGRTP